ncbi:hypothetical protein, partial [Chamaesiphon polymorphus]|uniref:hypothetical protein n=1 Tax=Chamaesiphon polymorphus TaxID=2107691 RepID=UPI001C631D2D
GNTSNYFLDMANGLKKIITKQTMPSVIEKLKNHTTAEVCELNLKKSQSCHEILWQCAQTLSYPKFHAAWHQTSYPKTDLDRLAQHHR